jgi:ribonuclease P protein subunit POP4
MMGRREAAEKGLWRLREEEARCVFSASTNFLGLQTRFFFFLIRWDLFVPLHRLWLGYMSELLALSPRPPPPPKEKSAEGEDKKDEVASRAAAISMPQAAGMHVKLVKADFHGSIMTGQFSS